MKIIILGNGFDLAHNLPTKYTDFLTFVQFITDYLAEKNKVTIHNLNWNPLQKELRTYIQSLNDSWQSSSIIADWNRKVNNNFWFQYFKECDMHGSENWIDFESEISAVVQKVNNYMEHHKVGLYDKETLLLEEFERDDDYTKIIRRISNIIQRNLITYKEIRDTMLTGLEDLIEVLEWYLTAFIANLQVTVRSKDIESLKPDKILSFNYTNTYQAIYDKKMKGTYDFIHGKALLDNSLLPNNMVLGIDEYLPKKRKNKDISFIAFKKFYQRIYKETGCEYKTWIEEIQSVNNAYFKEIKECKTRLKENKGIGMDGYETKYRLKDLLEEPPKYQVYIFGHSLDITDKDILKELILSEHVYTTIFYRNREHMGALITNLVKVIGQERLIQKTGGSAPTIVFKKQQDMYEKK